MNFLYRILGSTLVLMFCVGGCQNRANSKIAFKGGTINLTGKQERQLHTIPFNSKGELTITARSKNWSPNTSIGLQIWHPAEDGIVFRGGCYRIVIRGNAVINEEIPQWSTLKQNTRTYKLSWDFGELSFLIDEKNIATFLNNLLPSRSTSFNIRLNADNNDNLTIESYKGWYQLKPTLVDKLIEWWNQNWGKIVSVLIVLLLTIVFIVIVFRSPIPVAGRAVIIGAIAALAAAIIAFIATF